MLKASPIYLQGPYFVIAVPADGLAPLGARPSAGTVMTEKLDIYFFHILMVINDSISPLRIGCQSK